MSSKKVIDPFYLKGCDYLLGDEVQSKAIKITYQGVEITSKVIRALIKNYLQASEKQTYGKQNLRKLNRKGNTLDSIPVTNADLKGLQRELRNYGVDYSARKSISEKDTYELYFKGTDITQIQSALKNYAAKSLQQRERPTMKERMASAVQKAKERNVSRQQQQHEKKFERGRDER